MSKDLVSELSAEERVRLNFSLDCVSPNDGKYRKASQALAFFLSPRAEWIACAFVQRALLETRIELGHVHESHLTHFEKALEKIDPANISLLEEKITKHDQLALLEEFGRFIPQETKALLHPGTTSYDILDTARAYLFKKAWKDVLRGEIGKSILKLAGLAEQSLDILQVGRTHLQNTSPVPFGTTLAAYSARLAERTERCDETFDRLKGKISGIVGTGASIEMVVGDSLAFEEKVLAKLGLTPDYTATQIVQKEALADVGNSLVTLMHVLEDFSEDIRLLYSTAIGEVTSRDNATRLGGSSADALKNNPIDYENISGKAAQIESGMRVLYTMISSNFQRDLRGSIQARYQPQGMITEIYESFTRLNRALEQLSLNEDRIRENLQTVRDNPSEAMVAILRGEGWAHSHYGVGHDFVKEIGKKRKGRKLLEVALEDSEFTRLYETLSEDKKDILQGQLEKYTGSAKQRALKNIAYARSVIQ